MQPSYAPAGIAGRDGPPRRTPRWLIGCLGVLVAGALLLGGLSIGATLWALFPGEQVDTLAAIGPRTTLALHVRDEPGHPGVDALLDRVGQHMGELDAARKRGRLPEDARWVQDFQQRKEADADTLRLLLPSEATIAIEGAGRDATSLIVVNPHHLVRPLRAALVATAKPGQLHEAGDAVWLQTGDTVLGFLGGTVLWAAERERLIEGLDRLALEPGTGAAHPALRRALAPLAARWHVSLRAEGAAEELRRQAKEGLSWIDGDRERAPAMAEAQGGGARLSLGVAVIDEERLEGELRIEADDEASARLLRSAALEALERLARKGAEHGLTLTWAPGEEAGVWTLRCTGVAGFIDGSFTQLAAELEARERRR